MFLPLKGKDKRWKIDFMFLSDWKQSCLWCCEREWGEEEMKRI